MIIDSIDILSTFPGASQVCFECIWRIIISVVAPVVAILGILSCLLIGLIYLLGTLNMMWLAGVQNPRIGLKRCIIRCFDELLTLKMKAISQESVFRCNGDFLGIRERKGIDENDTT